MAKFEMPENPVELERRELAKGLMDGLESDDEVVIGFIDERARYVPHLRRYLEELAHKVRQGSFSSTELSAAIAYVRDLRRAGTETAEQHHAYLEGAAVAIERDPELKKFIVHLLGDPDRTASRADMEIYIHTLSAAMSLIQFEEVIELRCKKMTEELVDGGREKTGALFWEELWQTWKLLAPYSKDLHR